MKTWTDIPQEPWSSPWNFRVAAKPTWRDHREWDHLTPKTQAFAHSLKAVLPNTKYGNMIAPWFFKQYQAGNLIHPAGPYYGDPPHRAYMNALRKVKRLEKNPPKPSRWNNPLVEARDELRYAIEDMKENGGQWQVKGWPGEDENDSGHADLDTVVGDLIPFLKRRARAGLGQHNNLRGFQNPQLLHKAVNQEYLERMKSAGKVMHQFPNGWSVRQLMTPEDAEYEGRAMSNCIGDYSHQVPDKQIFSLRNPQGKPHVSWGVNGLQPPEAHSILGKGNEEPHDKYKAALKEYYETMPMKDRPRSRDGGPTISSHMQIGQPHVDEYGLPGEPDYRWTDLVRSAWSHDPQGNEAPGYYPENIQKVVDQAAWEGQAGSLQSGLVHPGSAMGNVLNNLKAEHSDAYEQLKGSAWAQTLAHFENMNAGDGLPNRGDVSRHYGAVKEPTPHINPDGHYCNCEWGAHRPKWTPDWEFVDYNEERVA